MKAIKTSIPDLIIIEPKIFEDSRGYFFESYHKDKFLDIGISDNFIQDNQSFSTYGTIRGLHLQKGDHAQSKLVRVLAGEVLDIAVDLRKGSPTFGKSVSVILSSDNKKMFYIPRGFAHGFAVLSSTAVFSYKCDNLYNKESESGIKFDDSDLKIDWKIPKDKMIISEKDLNLKSLKEFKETLL